MTTTQTSTPPTPTHIAYQVRENEKNSYWTRIGAAWAHKDGKGFNIQLECTPMNGRISLRIVPQVQ